jgi:hypothetical protein
MRLAACLTAIALFLGAATAGTALAAPTGPDRPSSAQTPHSESTISQNQLRDGWDPNEPGLAPAAVGGGQFGQLFATHVNGQVYAQPLVIDNPGTSTTAPGSSVIVATEDDYVYSLDGTTGGVQWSRSMGTPWASSVLGCGDLTPDIGITSTPVYDQSTNTLYVLAVTANGNTNTTTPTDTLYALDESTGATKWSKAISGSSTNTPSQAFNPEVQRQRPGLLLLNGSVYIGFGSICDKGKYNGFVAGVNTSSHAETLWAVEAGSVIEDGGVWGSGGGPVSFASMPGSFFISSGNGTSPPAGPGLGKAPGTLGDSLIRLDVQSNGTLKAGDFFSPANAPILDTTDRDWGSGGPVGLPFGTSAYPDLIVQAGKDGRVFLLNAQNLGGRGASTDNPVSENGPYGGQWGHPAAFAGTGGADYVYYSGTGYGGADYMRVLRFNGSNAARPVLTEAGNSATTFGYTSGSPVVTSNGTDPGSAVVWEVYSSGSSGVGGTLEAFSAVPVNGVLKQIWSAPIGLAAKFEVPATDGDRVYVGSRNDGTSPTAGVVYGFGLTSNPPFTGTGQLTLPDAGVGGTASSATVTLTAAQAMELTSAPAATSTTSPSPFTAGTATLNGQAISGYPAAVRAGDQLAIPVTFTPAAAGGSAGSLTLTTNVAKFASVTVPLAGNGTTPGLSVEPGTLAFGAQGTGNQNDPNNGPIPVGASEPIQADIVNTATVSETVTGITGPSAPFSLTAGLAVGQVLKPGQSAEVTVTYTPTAAASSDSGSLAVSYSDGTTTGTLALPMTGASVAGSGALTPSTTSVIFNHTPLGQNATATVTFTNTGNLPETVTSFSQPGVPFTTPVPVPKGLAIAPGDGLSLPVIYTPQSLGGVTASYQLTASDGHNPPVTQAISVTASAGRPSAGSVVPGPGGGWTLNGSALMSGTTLQLTQAAHYQAGSAVGYQPLFSNKLAAQFTEQSNGGSGADGMTFAMLNPQDPGTSLGGVGQLLGFGGLNGVAVVLGTRQDAGFPSANFVGIATGTASGHLVFAATSSSVPNLRAGTHVIGVSVAGTVITVTVDGKQYLSTSVPSLPPMILPAFTAGTGAADDVHALTNVAVNSNGTGTIAGPGGGWSYNGTAHMAGSDTALDTATTYVAGTVIYPHAVSTASLSAQFNVAIGGGTGANGLAFALLNPGTPASSVGSNGRNFGLGGLTGAAVVLSTYPVYGIASNNFISIITMSSSGLNFVATRVPLGQLRTGIHTMKVTVSKNPSGTSLITVYMDGNAIVSSHSFALPSTSMLAFTGATGGLTDVHTVSDTAIAAG